MGPITAILPVPREVTLGGKVYLIGQARLLDLAELQGLLDGQAEDPLAELEAAMAEADEDVRHERLVELYSIAKRGALVYGDRDGKAYFRESVEGICLLLWVVLKRYQPTISTDDCVAIASKMTRAEFGRFYRIFHGTNALELLTNLLLGKNSSPDVRDPITWSEAIDELARDRGWTYEYIYSLTLTEWVNARTNGKPSKPGRSLRPGEDRRAVMRDWMKRFGRFARKAKSHQHGG